jgi:hypothetical protein
VGGAAAPGLRPGRLSVPALRRPAADRWGPNRRREPAGLARAARVGDRLAIRGAVALAAATGSVAEHATRPGIHSPDPDLARRLPPGFVLALAAPGFFLRMHGSRQIAALLSTSEGHRPSRTLDFALRGARSWPAAGGKGEGLAAPAFHASGSPGPASGADPSRTRGDAGRNAGFRRALPPDFHGRNPWGNAGSPSKVLS